VAERLARLGQRPAALFFIGGDAARREELAHGLERRLWDDGYTAHALAPRDLTSLRVLQSLGLISLVVTDGSEELSAVRGSLGAEQVFEVQCGDTEAAESIETVVARLRDGGIIR
jgi:bifunctional enzyme CysN/CysC